MRADVERAIEHMVRDIREAYDRHITPYNDADYEEIPVLVCTAYILEELKGIRDALEEARSGEEAARRRPDSEEIAMSITIKKP